MRSNELNMHKSNDLSADFMYCEVERITEY